MNPDEGPHATGDIPWATIVNGLITCPHCSGWIDSSADHAGQIVACPHCGGHLQLHQPSALGFVPPPVPRGGSPPQEPWFYGFIDTYARIWMWFSLFAGALAFLGATGATILASRATVPVTENHIRIVIFVFITTTVVLAFWMLGILLSVAFMHLAVDIGRTLRAIRHHTPDRGR
jgi:hypothetical protein